MQQMQKQFHVLFVHLMSTTLARHIRPCRRAKDQICVRERQRDRGGGKGRDTKEKQQNYRAIGEKVVAL